MASRAISGVASCSKQVLKEGRRSIRNRSESIWVGSSSRNYASSHSPEVTTSSISPSDTIPRLPNIPGPHNLSQPQAALLPPKTHPRTHGIHVASLQLRSHVPDRLVQYTDFALHSAYSMGIPCSRPASLPVDRSLYTVTKSPFVHKKAQENFEKRTHKRLVKVWDTDPEVLDKWFRYLQRYSMAGVGMKAEVFEWAEVGCGKRELDEVMQGLKKVGLDEQVKQLAEGVQRDLREDASADREAAVEGEGSERGQAKSEA